MERNKPFEFVPAELFPAEFSLAMTTQKSIQKETQLLVDALRENTISDAQFARLTDLLRESCEARKLYIQFTAMRASLESLTASIPACHPSAVEECLPRCAAKESWGVPAKLLTISVVSIAVLICVMAVDTLLRGGHRSPLAERGDDNLLSVSSPGSAASAAKTNELRVSDAARGLFIDVEPPAENGQALAGQEDFIVGKSIVGKSPEAVVSGEAYDESDSLLDNQISSISDHLSCLPAESPPLTGSGWLHSDVAAYLEAEM